MALDAESMATRIEIHVDAIAGHQSDSPEGMAAYRHELYVAMCQGIIEEIVANSELVPVTTDSGEQGEGIITGTVK